MTHDGWYDIKNQEAKLNRLEEKKTTNIHKLWEELLSVKYVIWRLLHKHKK